MSFQFEYIRVRDLPPLSWLAFVGPETGLVRVFAGQDVECRDRFFVEGTWDGLFEDGAFDESESFFGSGALLKGETVVFVPSAATVDFLYYVIGDQGLMVANSLPLLLAAIGDGLDPQCQAYDEINNSIAEGIFDYVKNIPTRKGGVTRLVYFNLRVGGEGVHQEPKPLPPEFTDYKSYYSYLKDGVDRIVSNARSPSRDQPLTVVSTQSRGYDSTAINALVGADNIDVTYTLPSSKEVGRHTRPAGFGRQDDSGDEICGYLDLNCAHIDRLRFLKNEDFEKLAFSTLHTGEDVNLADLFERAPRPAVFLTGTLGEIWHTASSKYGRGEFLRDCLKRGDLSLHGLVETRLNAGLIQVAVPFIGARRRSEIAQISNSDELAPWRLQTDYDRPIARRMAEEAGVPREAFGQKKMATVLSYPRPPVPFHKPMRQRFFKFLIANRLVSHLTIRALPLVQKYNEIIHFHSPTKHRYVYYFERLIARITGRPFRFGYALRRLNGALFCFSVNERTADYEVVMGRILNQHGLNKTEAEDHNE